jgi:hypothetical protein
MKRLTAGLLLTSMVGLGFAACQNSVETSFQGHPAYAPPVRNVGNGPPAQSSGIGCGRVEDCDYWLCSCSDGSLVAAAVCENGFCLNADGACSLGCDYFGDGPFTGGAEGGPGSGIGGPGDDDGGGGAGGGGIDCAVDGDGCGSDDDCCNGFCASDGVCGDSSSCAPDGDPCASDDECCAGVCADDGYCGEISSCTPSGDFCASDDECCSAVCDADGFCI